MGMNISAPYPFIACPEKGVRISSLLPPTEDRVELELRRNVFWSAYCIERLYSCGNSWPLSLGDEDILQVMPCSLKDFESGVRLFPVFLEHNLNIFHRFSPALKNVSGLMTVTYWLGIQMTTPILSSSISNLWCCFRGSNPYVSELVCSIIHKYRPRPPTMILG